jgi:hypothetical protein
VDGLNEALLAKAALGRREPQHSPRALARDVQVSAQAVDTGLPPRVGGGPGWELSPGARRSFPWARGARRRSARQNGARPRSRCRSSSAAGTREAEAGAARTGDAAASAATGAPTSAATAAAGTPAAAATIAAAGTGTRTRATPAPRAAAGAAAGGVAGSARRVRLPNCVPGTGNNPTRPRSECGWSERPGRRAPGSTWGPATLADRRLPGFTPVPGGHHRGGVTVVVTPPVRCPVVSRARWPV